MASFASFAMIFPKQTLKYTNLKAFKKRPKKNQMANGLKYQPWQNLQTFHGLS